MSKEQWIDWPTEPGRYWFYGYVHYESAKAYKADPELIAVKVAKTGQGDLVVYSSRFLYKNQAYGKFLPLSEPEYLPETNY